MPTNSCTNSRSVLRLSGFLHFAIVLGVVLFSACIASAQENRFDEPGGVASSHVVIRVKLGVAPVRLTDGRLSFRQSSPAPDANEKNNPRRNTGALVTRDHIAETMKRWDVQTIVPAFIHQPANVELAKRLGLDRFYKVFVPDSTDTVRFVNELKTIGAAGGVIELVETDGIGSIAATIPTDPQFQTQYGLLNTGQTVNFFTGTVGADINAVNLWDITTGSSDILIAFTDAGMSQHQDLAGRTITGWNSIDGSTNTSDACSSHGTHVAGIAAANEGNGFGIVGVNWQCQIMPIRVLDGCFGSELNTADGIIFAADAGADVINISLQFYDGTAALQSAVQYAYALGSLIVAATGNNNIEVAYPAKWSQTIAVAATNNRDEVAGFSNAGPETDIAAPGDDIWSLTGTTGFGFKDGTSMATPFVSGLVALMLTVDPNLTLEDVRNHLTSTAVDVAAPGFDNDSGWGRIDAFAALQAVVNNLPVPGDVNGDNLVNVQDLLLILINWGPCPGGPASCANADLNNSGAVDVLDLLDVLANWTPAS